MQAHHLITAPITSHSFNGDRSQVAICPNTNEAQIYQASGNGFTLAETLGEHDKVITSIDWAPHSNRIVTCSQDRNAYVWNYVQEPDTGKMTWKPTLVLLRINRSATVVRWSPNEVKFAVGSGARTVAVCSYDEEQNWWVAKHIKKPIRSTVLSLDWHPNNVLLATGSADQKARVFSAYIKGDEKPPASVWWGPKLPFNTLCAEYSTPSGGWVHGVAFSPSGDALAFTGHDSSVTVAYPGGEGQPPQALHQIRLPSLPFVSLLFTAENTIIAGGHDCEPMMLVGDATSGWKVNKSLDNKSSNSSNQSADASRSGGIGRLGGTNEAFNRFKAADSRGVSGSVAFEGSTVPKAGSDRVTVHQNTITSLRAYAGAPGQVNLVSSSGVDGRIVIWPVN